MKRILFAAWVPLVGFLACGGDVIGAGGSGNDGRGAGSDSGCGPDSVSAGAGGGDCGGTADSGVVTSISPSGCPSSEPVGGSCAPNGLTCEYGTNNGACGNPYVECHSGTWTALKGGVPPPGCLPSTGCAAEESDVVVGAPCGDQDLECNFPTGRCTCAEVNGGLIGLPDGGDLRTWECEVPSLGCPASRPRIGSDCANDGQTCAYGDCVMPDSVEIQCNGGRWESTPIKCGK